MFVATGVGPYSGQAVHFRHHATERIPYALNRYLFEAKRHYGILDDRLALQRYMLGDTYTIVDMAVWGWARLVPFVLGDDALDALSQRQAAGGRDQRPPRGRAGGAALKERHTFKTEMDAEARRHMFPHTVKAAP